MCYNVRMIFIYALVDPDSKKIRYIGKSIRPQQRLTNQMNESSNCHRSNWLQSLRANGKKPYQIILQELKDDADWQTCEIAWIRYGRQSGWPLTNNTDGGDGVCGLPEETRKLMASVWKGRKHKPETIEKLKAARAKRVITESTKHKQRESMKGREITWGEKISQSVRKLTEKDVLSILERFASGEKLVDMAKEYGVDRTTLTKVRNGTYMDKYNKKQNP